MRTLRLALLVLSVAAATAMGQAGTIGIYGDTQGYSCNLRDATPGLTPYYIVHVNTPGATACQYSAPAPWCLRAQWLSDTNYFPVTIGNSQNGVSVGYGACRTSPILVQAVNFFTRGLSPSCCCYFVEADSTAVPPGIYVVDCADNLLVATGGMGIINSTIGCQCTICASPECAGALDAGGCLHPPVPAQGTSWGRVKALYSE